MASVNNLSKDQKAYDKQLDIFLAAITALWILFLSSLCAAGIGVAITILHNVFGILFPIF